MRISLRVKYSSILVCLIATMIALVTIISLDIYKQSIADLRKTTTEDISLSIIKQMQTRAESIADLLSYQLVNPLYYYDIDQINNLLNDVLEQKNVLGTVVFDKNCRILHQGSERLTRFEQKVLNSEICNDQGSITLETRNENTITVSKPILFADQTLGGISVTISTEEVQQIIDESEKVFISREQDGIESFVTKLTFIAIILIVCALVVAIYIAGKLVAPIEQLSKHAKRIGRGKYNIEIKKHQNDEIGDLETAFDRMRLDLQSSTVSIEHLREEVAKKTEAERQRGIIEQQLQRALRMEAVGQLAAGIAHDLNNILSGIVTLPQLMLLDVEEGDPMTKPLLQMQKSGKRASVIVQDMLTLARSGMTAEEVIDPIAIVEAYLIGPEMEELKREYPEIVIQTDIDDDVMNIKGAPAQLTNVLMNLINNSAEAIRKSGEISISLHNTYVDKPFGTYDSVAEGDYVLLTIQDTGEGIAPENVSQIFEPFFTKKTMGRSGTGLGMAIVWNTVKDHRGYIDIISEPDAGTTVYLYFPVTRESLLKIAEPDIATTSGNGENILIVDDVAEQRQIAESILTRLSYKVTTVASGEEAIVYLEENTPDLIILDMIMDPGMDGLQTCQAILPSNPTIPIVIASGYSEEKNIREALRLGARKYIKKPYSIETLGFTVKDVIESSSA